MTPKHHKVALVTGAARRIGACIADLFHKNNYNIVVHYRHSKTDALALVATLNQHRNNSAIAIYADLDDQDAYEKLIGSSAAKWDRLDILINNASTFTPTPIGKINLTQWDYLFNNFLFQPAFRRN